MSSSEAYKQNNSKGIEYHLNVKTVKLRGGRQQTIYYFSKDFRAATSCGLPEGYVVKENVRNGMLFLAKEC